MVFHVKNRRINIRSTTSEPRSLQRADIEAPVAGFESTAGVAGALAGRSRHGAEPGPSRERALGHGVRWDKEHSRNHLLLLRWQEAGTSPSRVGLVGERRGMQCPQLVRMAPVAEHERRTAEGRSCSF